MVLLNKINIMSAGTDILLLFVALLVTIGVSLLFLWLIRRNINKEKEASQVIVEDAVTKKQRSE